VVIFGLQQVMKSRERFELTGFVTIHNMILCLLSFVMLVGMIFEISKLFIRWSYDVEMLLCDPKKHLAVGRQTWWFYIFFLSKYYELVDTVIIVLKKRPIIFLHVYHHCITVLLVYIMLDNEVAVQWISSIANVTVHIPMYFYYALSALGYTVWWKKYITKLQITQFVVDILANTIGLFYYTFYGTCSGALWSWIFGQAVLISFLFLFISFFRHNYSEGKIAAAGDKTKTTSNGHSNGHSDGLSNGLSNGNGHRKKQQ